MPKNNTLEIIVCSADANIFNWIYATTKLSELVISNIIDITPKNIGASLKKDKNENRVIITSEEYAKTCIKSLESIDYMCPILILTNSFNHNSFSFKKQQSIDTLPTRAITIDLLEHAIRSLIKDYKQNVRLIKLAHFDPLTGAANRLLFQDRLNETLKRTKRYKEDMSLVYFDLDKFKPINDRYGHDTGDFVLKKFVEIIGSSVRETDTLARLGGDEFALVLPKTTEESLTVFCNKIIDLLNKKYVIGSHQLYIECSIGAVHVSPSMSQNLAPEEIVKIADKAVYKAKKVDGASFHIEQLHTDNN